MSRAQGPDILSMESLYLRRAVIAQKRIDKCSTEEGKKTAEQFRDYYELQARKAHAQETVQRFRKGMGV
jgi:hypothetical protein